MTFRRVGTYLLTKNWVLTPLITGEIVRITHYGIYNPEQYLKGVISLAFQSSGVNLLSPKRLTFRQEKDLYEFQIPTGVQRWSLALKRLDDTPAPWRVGVEVFDGYVVQTNLANEITTKVLEAMSNIYARANQASLTPKSGEKNLSAGVVGTLIEENSKRAYLSIRVGDEAVTLYAGKDDAGEPINVIEKLAAGEVYNLPTADGVYKGDIFALAMDNTSVEFTEFTA